MSRAIEKDVAASLEKGNAIEAYKEISEILNPVTGGYELEILGKAHPLPPGTNVLKDGPAAGISKLALVQAFLVAHKILSEHIRGPAPKTDEELLAATSVALLMDPEHLTAANIRKRIITARVSPGEHRDGSVLQQEKSFIDAFLKGRLHRHTKSPTLWSHRRWLMTVSKSAGCGWIHPSAGDLDLTTVMVAAERHPMNYYAWTHARWLIKSISHDSFLMRRYGRSVMYGVKEWCLKHHTDVSGWSFLQHVLTLEGWPAELQNAPIAIYTEVLDRVMTFRWAGEAVWSFLRTLAASGVVGEDGVGSFMKVAAMLKKTLPPGVQDWNTLDNAESWCRQYERKSET